MTINFDLSEASPDFSDVEFSISGGALGNLTGSGTTYSAIFSDNNSLTAAVISLRAGDFSDLSGNDNLAASLMVPVNTDAEAPTVSITSDFVGVLVVMTRLRSPSISRACFLF